MKKIKGGLALFYLSFFIVGCNDMPRFLKSDETLKLERIEAENLNLKLKNEQLKLEQESNKSMEKRKLQEDENCFKDAKTTNTRASYGIYLQRYPIGIHSIEANQKIDELLEQEQQEEIKKTAQLKEENQKKVLIEMTKLIKSALTCESRYTKISEVNVTNIKQLDENGSYMLDGEYTFFGKATFNLETTGSYKAKIDYQQKLTELWWQDMSRSAYAKEVCLK